MITFEEFQSKVTAEELKYGSCRGFPYNRSKFNNLATKDRADYSDEFFKEFFGRQWRMRLKRMKNVTTFLLRQDEDEPVMLSVRQFGKKSAKVSETQRVIDDLIDLNVLRVFNASYSHNDGKARMYKLNYSNLLCLRAFIPEIREDTNIGVDLYNNINDDDNNIINVIDIDNYVKVEEEEEVCSRDPSRELEAIKTRLTELVAEQNALESDNFFRYKFPRNCCRAYSDFCYQPTLKKKHKVEHAQYRETILAAKFPEVALAEQDRIASIHNLNRFLKTNILTGNNRELNDFYQEFAGRELTTEERNDYKMLMMTFYFSNQRKWNSLVRHVIAYIWEGDSQAHRIAKLGFSRIASAWNLIGIKTFNSKEELELALRDFYKASRARLEQVEGELIGKDIFLYENVQNLSVEVELRKLGYIVETVYDGFYTNAPEDIWWNVYRNKLFELKTLIDSVEEN